MGAQAITTMALFSGAITHTMSHNMLLHFPQLTWHERSKTPPIDICNVEVLFQRAALAVRRSLSLINNLRLRDGTVHGSKQWLTQDGGM